MNKPPLGALLILERLDLATSHLLESYSLTLRGQSAARADSSSPTCVLVKGFLFVVASSPRPRSVAGPLPAVLVPSKAPPEQGAVGRGPDLSQTPLGRS